MRKFGALMVLVSLAAVGLVTPSATSGSAPAGVRLSGVGGGVGSAGKR
jgi:hypothetical protein